MKKCILLIVIIAISCQTKVERKFSFNIEELSQDSLEVKFYNENDPKKYFFEVDDSLVLKKIFQTISNHSEKNYVGNMPTNYADSFFDFTIAQNGYKFLITTGNIKEPNNNRKGFVYIFRKESIGYVPEGRFYCDTVFEILKKYKQKKNHQTRPLR